MEHKPLKGLITKLQYVIVLHQNLKCVVLTETHLIIFFNNNNFVLVNVNRREYFHNFS